MSEAVELSVEPLTQRQSASLLRSILPPAALSETLAHDMLTRAERNPLFLELVARHALELGERAGDLPATIHQLLQARIDRIPSECCRRLEHAAELGVEFPTWLLTEVWDHGSSVPRDTLGWLVGEDFSVVNLRGALVLQHRPE